MMTTQKLLASLVSFIRSQSTLRLLLVAGVLGGGVVIGASGVVAARRTREGGAWSVLNLFSPSEALTSILVSVRSPHLRNLCLIAAATTFLGRVLARRMFRVDLELGGTFSLLLGTFWLLWYHFFVVERPLLEFTRTLGNLHTLSRLSPRLTFRPHPLFNPHLQTVLLNALNALDAYLQPYSGYRRQTIKSADGNDVHLDWVSGDLALALPADAPVCLLFHGIAGTREDHYMRNMTHCCAQHGWRAVALDRWRLDYGSTVDVECAVVAIRRQYPRARIAAVGFSAGAHVLLSYLARTGKANPLIGAAIVSPALDLARMIRKIELDDSLSYLRMAMEAASIACVRRHAANDRHCDEDAAERLIRKMQRELLGCHWLYDNFICTLPTFSGKDEDVPRPPEQLLLPDPSASPPSIDPEETRPFPHQVYSRFGNPTHTHYRLTVAANLHKIETPLFCLMSRDDPLIPKSFVRIMQRAAATNPSIILATTQRGGHCAFHEGILFPSGPSYGERLVVDFLSALLDTQAHTEFVVEVVGRVYGLRPPPGSAVDRAHEAARRMRGARKLHDEELSDGSGEDDDSGGEAAPGSLLAKIMSSSKIRMASNPSFASQEDATEAPAFWRDTN